MLHVTDNQLETARLFSREDVGAVEEVRIAGGLAVVYTARSPCKESANEDAALLGPCCAESGILAIADGVGGERAGGDAAALAMKTLAAAINQGLDDDALLRTAILNGVETANLAVQTMGVGAATTLVVVEVRGRTVRTYHVGDSMVLVVGQRGKIKLQTTSHSPVGYGVEAGLLDERDAMHHEDRHIVSNVIGSPDMKIEIGPILRLAPRDTVLLASDGLFDNLHVDEIVSQIQKGPLRTAVERMVADAHNRMTEPRSGQSSKPDDLTIVAYRRTALAERRPSASK
jgi:serine/threonine protein phosphatase PrpC